MSWLSEAWDGISGQGNIKLGKEAMARGQALQDKAEAGRVDQQLPPELLDALGLAKSGVAQRSSLGDILSGKADKMYSRRLSSINRNATSGAEAQIATEGANDQLSSDYIDASASGVQADQQLQQQNKASYYGLSGELASQRNQMYQNNVLLPYLQRLTLSQSQMQNGMNYRAAGMNQAGGLLKSIIQTAGSVIGA